MPACTDCGRPTDAKWKKLCRDCFIAQKRIEEATDKYLIEFLMKRCAELEKQQQQKIPEDMMKRLLMLCHPDKHGNSTLSNDVTKWLLKQRSAR